MLIGMSKKEILKMIGKIILGCAWFALSVWMLEECPLLAIAMFAAFGVAVYKGAVKIMPNPFEPFNKES